MFKVILTPFHCSDVIIESVYFCLALSPTTVPVLVMFFLFFHVFMCIPVWAQHK